MNVFLGIGLPWTIGAIYWRAKGEAGMLEAPSLEQQSSPKQRCYHGTLGSGLPSSLQRFHGAAGPPSRGAIMAARGRPKDR